MFDLADFLFIYFEMEKRDIKGSIKKNGGTYRYNP